MESMNGYTFQPNDGFAKNKKATGVIHVHFRLYYRGSSMPQNVLRLILSPLRRWTTAKRQRDILPFIAKNSSTWLNVRRLGTHCMWSSPTSHYKLFFQSATQKGNNHNKLNKSAVSQWITKQTKAMKLVNATTWSKNLGMIVEINIESTR